MLTNDGDKNSLANTNETAGVLTLSAPSFAFSPFASFVPTINDEVQSLVNLSDLMSLSDAKLVPDVRLPPPWKLSPGLTKTTGKQKVTSRKLHPAVEGHSINELHKMAMLVRMTAWTTKGKKACAELLSDFFYMNPDSAVMAKAALASRPKLPQEEGRKQQDRPLSLFSFAHGDLYT
jgi:hypothetical protein